MKTPAFLRLAGRVTALAAATSLVAPDAANAIVLGGVDGDGISSDSLLIIDGGGDIFDDGMAIDNVVVNGVFGFFETDTFIDTEPSYFGAGPVFDSDSDEPIPGFRIERRVQGIDSNGETEVFDADDEDIFATDYTFVRYLDTFINTSDEEATIEVSYFTDMGTDDFNSIQTENGGFGEDLETEDRWFIHGSNEEDEDDDTDPVAGFVLHDGTLEVPTDVFAAGDDDFDNDDQDGDEDVEWTYEFDLGPGESKSLLYFLTARNETDEFEDFGTDDDAREDLSELLGIELPDEDDVGDDTATLGFISVADPFSIDPRFYDGITPEQADTIINFSVDLGATTDTVIPEPFTGGLAVVALSSLAIWRRRPTNV